MTKNIEAVYLGDYFEGDRSTNINIDKVIDFLVARKNEGAEELNFNIDEYDCFNIEAFKLVEESDEVFQKRVDSEIERNQNYEKIIAAKEIERNQNYEKIIAAKELKEYERLKIKYNGR